MISKPHLFQSPARLLTGIDSRKEIGRYAREYNGNVVLVCTEKAISLEGMLVDILAALSRDNLAYVVFGITREIPAPRT